MSNNHLTKSGIKEYVDKYSVSKDNFDNSNLHDYTFVCKLLIDPSEGKSSINDTQRAQLHYLLTSMEASHDLQLNTKKQINLVNILLQSDIHKIQDRHQTLETNMAKQKDMCTEDTDGFDPNESVYGEEYDLLDEIINFLKNEQMIIKGQKGHIQPEQLNELQEEMFKKLKLTNLYHDCIQHIESTEKYYYNSRNPKNKLIKLKYDPEKLTDIPLSNEETINTITQQTIFDKIPAKVTFKSKKKDTITLTPWIYRSQPYLILLSHYLIIKRLVANLNNTYSWKDELTLLLDNCIYFSYSIRYRREKNNNQYVHIRQLLQLSTYLLFWTLLELDNQQIIKCPIKLDNLKNITDTRYILETPNSSYTHNISHLINNFNALLNGYLGGFCPFLSEKSANNFLIPSDASWEKLRSQCGRIPTCTPCPFIQNEPLYTYGNRLWPDSLKELKLSEFKFIFQISADIRSLREIKNGKIKKTPIGTLRQIVAATGLPSCLIDNIVPQQKTASDIHPYAYATGTTNVVYPWQYEYIVNRKHLITSNEKFALLKRYLGNKENAGRIIALRKAIKQQFSGYQTNEITTILHFMNRIISNTDQFCFAIIYNHLISFFEPTVAQLECPENKALKEYYKAYVWKTFDIEKAGT